MENELIQLLHLPPHEVQDHLMLSPVGFFAVHGGDAHFPSGGSGAFVAAPPGLDDDCSWVEDLVQQLGDELFAGGGDDAAAGTGEGMNNQPWQQDNGGSPDDPPPSMSLDGGGSPRSGEQGAGELASEPHRDQDAARKRRDRTKTIVSERKRRVRMKEKLYELRALVPNITKMDKASIIADAVAYVKDLQAHARKLKDEVAALEARPRSLPGHEKQHGRRSTAAAAVSRRQGRGEDDGDDDTGRHGGGVRVTRVGAAGVGEGRFFVTVECERRDGVAAPLCAAVESLACFRVENSSLVSLGSDRLVSTLTLKVNEGQVGDATVCEGSVVKLLLMAALLKEGFRHEQTVEIS